MRIDSAIGAAVAHLVACIICGRPLPLLCVATIVAVPIRGVVVVSNVMESQLPGRPAAHARPSTTSAGL